MKFAINSVDRFLQQLYIHQCRAGWAMTTTACHFEADYKSGSQPDKSWLYSTDVGCVCYVSYVMYVHVVHCVRL